MPEARSELLDAAGSYAGSGENRLTELLATVLAAHHDLTATVLREVGVPVGHRFVVLTQQRVAPGCIPDLVVHSLSPSGSRLGQLWSEHKTVSGFRHEQREDYILALEREPGEGRLLTITVAHTDEPSGAWSRLTWQELGELADAVGRAWQGDDWRRAALKPDAPARERLLHEFVWYLEEEGFAVVRPISSDDVRVFKGLLSALDAIEELMVRIGDHLGIPEAELSQEDDAYWYFLDAEDSWLERVAPFEGRCALLLSADDGWWPQGEGEPALGVGYTLDKRLYGALSSDRDWIERLERSEFTLELWDDAVRCYRTRTLASFIDAGSTLNAQAVEIVRWARESLKELSQLAPSSDLKLPSAPKPRTRGTKSLRRGGRT